MPTLTAVDWARQVIKQDEIDRYLKNGEDFINEGKINSLLTQQINPDKARVKDILQKSLRYREAGSGGNCSFTECER